MKVIISALLLAVATADHAPYAPPPPPHPPPPYPPAPSAPAPAYPDEAPVYTYVYSVADDYSKAAFGANEARDGYSTTGSYTVNLPDGRVQTVNYNVADANSGYVAEVTYSGEAQYPEAAPYHPAQPTN